MFDARELLQRDLRSAGCRNQDLPECVRVGAILGRVAHAHVESRASLDRGGEYRFANSRLDDLLNLSDADAVSRGSRSIDFDVQVLTAGDLLGVDVAGAGYPAHDIRNTTCRLFEHWQIS